MECFQDLIELFQNEFGHQSEKSRPHGPKTSAQYKDGR